MDILAPTSIKNLRQIKKFLAQKSLDLSEMYQATYSRIRSSDTTTADLARRVILWICYAQRPLHEIELQHAIATELGDEDFDPDGITSGDEDFVLRAWDLSHTMTRGCTAFSI